MQHMLTEITVYVFVPTSIRSSEIYFRDKVSR